MLARDLGDPKQNTSAIQTTTIRDFDGGWNVADTELNMKSKYAVILDNMERGIDGTLAVRPGTRYFGALDTEVEIVNCIYFDNQIICVQSDGVISTVTSDGLPTHLQESGTDPWGGSVGDTTHASFTIFNGDLILVDGVHKPLIISGHQFNPDGTVNAQYGTLEFLVDIGSGSNVNTPVAKYVISHGQYTIMANLAAATGVGPRPSSIIISSRGTSGTYVGDAPPNDSVEIDLGPRVSLGSANITGLVAYRDKLLVAFERGVLPLNLGVYTGSPEVHTPTDDGFVEEFGCLAHRSMISVGDDTFYMDSIGVNSIQRVTLFNTLRPQRVSELIDPDLTEHIRTLPVDVIETRVFSVYDTQNRRYMLFVPTWDADNEVQTGTIGYSYTNIPTLKVEAWARLTGWNWRSATRTALQSIVFTVGHKLYTYDFTTDNGVDFRGDSSINSGNGTPIAFTWELPWADFTKRMNTKRSVYIALDSEGEATFTLKMYVDNIMLDRDGNDAPALEVNFQGGERGAFGGAPYGRGLYGGGVPARDERLFAWPSRFKMAKFSISGSTDRELRIVSLSIAYQVGSIRR